MIIRLGAISLVALLALSGCAEMERQAQVRRDLAAQDREDQFNEQQRFEKRIAAIPEADRLECKMQGQATLASERVYNVGLPTLWSGQQTTYGQGALQVYYTCLDMKLAQIAAKKSAEVATPPTPHKVAVHRPAQ